MPAYLFNPSTSDNVVGRWERQVGLPRGRPQGGSATLQYGGAFVGWLNRLDRSPQNYAVSCPSMAEATSWRIRLGMLIGLIVLDGGRPRQLRDPIGQPSQEFRAVSAYDGVLGANRGGGECRV